MFHVRPLPAHRHLPCYPILAKAGRVFWHKAGSNAGIGRCTAERLLATVGRDRKTIERRLLDEANKID